MTKFWPTGCEWSAVSNFWVWPLPRRATPFFATFPSPEGNANVMVILQQPSWATRWKRVERNTEPQDGKSVDPGAFGAAPTAPDVSRNIVRGWRLIVHFV